MTPTNRQIMIPILPMRILRNQTQPPMIMGTMLLIRQWMTMTTRIRILTATTAPFLTQERSPAAKPIRNQIKNQAKNLTPNRIKSQTARKSRNKRLYQNQCHFQPPNQRTRHRLLPRQTLVTQRIPLHLSIRSDAFSAHSRSPRVPRLRSQPFHQPEVQTGVMLRAMYLTLTQRSQLT